VILAIVLLKIKTKFTMKNSRGNNPFLDMAQDPPAGASAFSGRRFPIFRV
jgi:hypothetical protein